MYYVIHYIVIWRMGQGFDPLSVFKVMTARHCSGSVPDGIPFTVVAGDHNWQVEEGTEQRRNYSIWLRDHPGWG